MRATGRRYSSPSHAGNGRVCGCIRALPRGRYMQWPPRVVPRLTGGSPLCARARRGARAFTSQSVSQSRVHQMTSCMVPDLLRLSRVALMLVLVPHARPYATSSARSTVCRQPRHTHALCGVAADVLVKRLRASRTEAIAAEQKLLTSIAEDLDPDRAVANCDALQQRLKLSDAALRRMMCRHPTLLRSSYVKTIAPSLDALSERLGLTEEALRRVVKRHPASIVYNFEPSLTALQRRLALSDGQVSQIICAARAFKRRPARMHVSHRGMAPTCCPLAPLILPQPPCSAFPSTTTSSPPCSPFNDFSD